MSFLKSAVAAAGLMALMGSANAVVLIDDFSLPSPGSQTIRDTCATLNTVACTNDPLGGTGNGGQGTAGVGSSLAGSTTNIIGGERDIFVIKTNDSVAPESEYTGVTARVASGAFNFSSDPSATAVGIIRWDGKNSDIADAGFKAVNAGFGQDSSNSIATNISNAIGSINQAGFAASDLTVGNAAGFIVTVINTDDEFPFTLQVFSGAGNMSALVYDTQTVGPGRTFPAPHDYFIPFAAFVPILGTGADFTAVTALQAIINFSPLIVGGGSVQDVDIQIRLAETGTLPEPAGLALVGLGLVGAGLARRRMTVAK